MTRGERLCNPGCIRRDGTKWQGLAATQTDPQFFTFSSPEYGIRAIAKILTSYQREGVKTLYGAISRWAPPSENDTSAYIIAVCGACHVSANDQVELTQILPALIKAIITHENGACIYSDQQITDGITLAHGQDDAKEPAPMTPKPNNARSNTVMLTLVAALVVPKVQKLTGITLSLEDVADLMGLVVVAWHGGASILDRYFPPTEASK